MPTHQNHKMFQHDSCDQEKNMLHQPLEPQNPLTL
jgi:hypothetical protein